MKKIIILLIAFFAFEKAYSQITDKPIFKKGQIIQLGSPSKINSKQDRRDNTTFNHIYRFYYNPKQELSFDTFTPNYTNQYVKNSTDPNSFTDWLNTFPSKKFLIDSVVNLDGNQYLICHWIDNRGLLYSPESHVNYDFPVNSYFINSPQEAISSGEIILTNETYKEPYLFTEPTRAVQLFLERNSKLNLSVIILVFAILVLLLNRIKIYRTLESEILNGGVENIPQSEYIKKIYKSEQDHKVTESRLLRNMRKTNPEMADAFANWDKESYNLLQATKKVMEKYGKSTSEIDAQLRDWDSDVDNDK